MSILMIHKSTKINELVPDEAIYFKMLKTIAKPPKRLWYSGTLLTDIKPTVAIVGTRRPTSYGKEISSQIAGELARAGVTIVSGLAFGIDATAHRAALESGGTTIAVLPGDLKSIYPRTHHKLASDIVQNGGALLTEYENGAEIYRGNFIARNRIVSGISDIIIVVEASAKSGTMHTVNFALEQGKSVMAVPGNITSPVSVGCNNLIKTGARPVTDIRDVFEELGIDPSAQQTLLPLGDTLEEQAILKLIIDGERDTEKLLLMSRLEPQIFSQTLTMLELTRKIRPLGNNKWCVR